MLPMCRRYVDIAEKLGGQQEAADDMGDLLSGIAGGFASERAITEVQNLLSPPLPSLQYIQDSNPACDQVNNQCREESRGT